MTEHSTLDRCQEIAKQVCDKWRMFDRSSPPLQMLIATAIKNEVERLEAENARLKEQVVDLQAHADFFGKLIERNEIGTKETPSLRAYIERIEEKNRVMREALKQVIEDNKSGATSILGSTFMQIRDALERAGKE